MMLDRDIHSFLFFNSILIINVNELPSTWERVSEKEAVYELLDSCLYAFGLVWLLNGLPVDNMRERINGYLGPRYNL